MTVGGVAVSLQGGGAVGQADRAGGNSVGYWARVSRWVAVRPGRGNSCWQLLGAYPIGKVFSLYPLLILSDGRGMSVVEGSYLPYVHARRLHKN